ncbi:MAG: Hsp33 family molecular chaperone HslO [Pseudomonadota bacterium]|nr:Hsp33 family molecular chaperone HslO [Pseudomonadota bacterium]
MPKRAFWPGACHSSMAGGSIVQPRGENFVQPFQLENGVARGRLARLGSAAEGVLSAREYPAGVAFLLAEVMALSALVIGLFKFDGVLSLQAKGDGPVSLILVDLTSEGGLRGFAQFDPQISAVTLDTLCVDPVPHLLGKGYLAFTIDQGPNTDRYQGIVELAGKTISDCAHHYFRESDQLEVAVNIRAEKTASHRWRSGGLLMQKIPPDGRPLESGESDNTEFQENWRRARVFANNVRGEELLDDGLHPHDLLMRLFERDGVRVFDPLFLENRCRCSNKRVEMMLKSFPKEEIEVLRVDGVVTIKCEFCGVDYKFEEYDIAQIYTIRR